MNTVRHLRNSALHYHSIWHWKDLKVQHAQMHVLIGYICSSIAKMAKEMDHLPSIYAGGASAFQPAAASILEM
jgi:hypothetical protein